MRNNKIIFKTLMLKGEAGATIASMERTGHVGTTDIYTITFSDGTTAQIPLENMSAIISVEKTSQTDTQDIYTITCADGSTQTFSVLNHNADFANMEDHLDDQIAEMESDIAEQTARIDYFLATQTGTINGTKRTETVLFESATPSRGTVIEVNKRYLEIEDEIDNYDYIEIYYGAFDKYNLIKINPSDVPEFIVPLAEDPVIWAEDSVPESGGSSNYRAEFEMYKYPSEAKLHFAFSRWRIYTDINYYANDEQSLAQSGIGILKIVGIKYTTAETSKDPELTDVRVGADGVTYASAGAAVRGQITAIKEDLSAVESVLEMTESAYTFVDSVEEMTDHTKSYVLRSNNHIYTAQEVQGDPPNEFAVRLLNKRVNSTSPFVETMNGYLTTEYIPFTQDDFSATIRLKNGAYLRDRYGTYNYGSCKIVGYDANKANIINSHAYLGGRSSSYSYLAMTKDGNDLVGSFAESDGARNAFINAGADNLEYVAFCFPIATEYKDDVTDADLSAITQAEVDAKDLGIYISTHGVATYQFVDTGTVYVQQSAIQRINEELAEKLDANQGSANVGKVLMVGEDGTVEPTDVPEPTTDDDYKITLTVGAWGANGKTPTSDGNQLRNTELIPLMKARKIKINLPSTLSKCTGHAYILDSEQNLIGVTPWGAYIDLNSVASNAVYANISISAFDLNDTAITAIAPYLEDVQSNIVVYSPNSAEAMDSFRNKTHGTVMFNDYILSEVNATITALQDVQFAHPNALTLAFMTDLHFGRTAFDTNVNLLDNLACVQMVSSECAIGGLMMGGDNIAESSTRANQILNLKEYGRKVRQFGDRVFSTKGNHDDSSISGWDSSASKTKVGYNLFDPEYYLWTERQIENLPNVVFPDDPTGLYYYVDFPAEKVRLIVLNSVDIPYVEDPNNAGYLVYRGQSDYGYSNAQLNWVAHTALDFSDKKDADEWGVVTMQHVQDNPNISAFSTASVRYNGAQMYNIFKAFKARSTYSSTSADTYFPHDVSVDFTNATQELIARISGHTHADRYVLSDDGLHISTMQAGPNSVGNSPASDGVTYTKTAGTGEESAVDFFTFDRIGKKVYCTRYGAGLSRELSWV